MSAPSSRASAHKVFVLAALLASSCGEHEQAPTAGAAPPPTPVTTAVVRRAPMAETYRTVGTVEAAESIQVVSEIDGIVETLPFEEGEAVRKGDVLARLRDAELAAQVEHGRAVLQRARKTLERLEALVAQGIATPQSLDDASSAVRVASADLALANARLGKTVIAAPWDGVVSRRHVSPGAYVRAGDPLTELASVREVEVPFFVPERHLASLVPGSTVTLSSPAWPGVALDARVTLVDPLASAATRSIRMVARADNAEGKLRPGMSADVLVRLDEREQALVVPAEAVFVEGGQAMVNVVGEGGAVTRTKVTLGARTAEEVEIVSGVAEGTRVVRAGHQKLYEGARVAPIDESEEPAAGNATGAR